MLGFRICAPDIGILTPRHVATRHTDQKRPGTEAGGRWRNLTEADGIWRKQTNGIGITRFGRFLPQIRPMACWCSRYALPTSSSWSPDMLPSATRTRSDQKRKLTESENGLNRTSKRQNKSEIPPRPVGFLGFPSPCRHPDASGGAGATQGGGRRKPAEADGISRKQKMA